MAGVTIAHTMSGNTGTTAANVNHGSAHAAMNAFNRDSSQMTAKQAELHNMRIRSQESRYQLSSF